MEETKIFVDETPNKTAIEVGELDECRLSLDAAKSEYEVAKREYDTFDVEACINKYVSEGYSKKLAIMLANDERQKLKKSASNAMKLLQAAQVRYNKAERAESKRFEEEMKYERRALTEQKRNEREAAKRALVEERISSILERFDGTQVADSLRFTDDGMIKNCTYNVIQLLTHGHQFSGVIEFNEFTNQVEWRRESVDEHHFNEIMYEVEEELGITNQDTIARALDLVGHNLEFHPIKEVLDTLQWDGKSRVATFFIDRLGAPDEPYIREMTCKWFYAMVERLYNPGCTFDHFLIISDRQGGTGKTKTFKRLTEALHCDVKHQLTNTICDISNVQNNYQLLQRSIIGLFDESEGMKYSNLEKFKSFVTEQTFTARLPYARTMTDMPIHSVFAVNTNDEEFLTDIGYERRAWVMRCNGKPNMPADYWRRWNNDTELQQVWAEVMAWRRDASLQPYDMTDCRYNDLTAESTDALYGVQTESKTFQANTILMTTVENILTSMYSKEVFANQNEFETDYIRRTSNTFEKDYIYPLTCIPKQWLVATVLKLMRSKVKTDTVKSAIEDVMKQLGESNGYKWRECKHKRYGTQRLDAWVREASEFDIDEVVTATKPVPKATDYDSDLGASISDIIDGTAQNNTAEIKPTKLPIKLTWQQEQFKYPDYIPK